MILGGDTLGVEALAASVLRSTPTVTITSPSGLVSTSSITVTWSYSSPIGRPQAGFRVVLWSAAGAPLFDSGLQSGTATSYALGLSLTPFTSYRLFVGVSDGLDGAADPILFSPGWAYTDFSTAFSDVDYDDASNVGSIYEVGINGVGYMLADHPDQQFRYQRQTVQLAPERLSTGSTPFSESIERYGFMAASNWTSGSGQTYLDRPESDPSQYFYSEWVNPFEMGELSLIATPNLHVSSTYAAGNDCRRAVVAGGTVYFQTGASQLTALDTPGGTTTAFSTGLAGTISGLASDGTYWYATDGATIRRNSTPADPGANWSTDDVSEIEWIGDRIAGFDNVAAPAEFVYFSPAGVQTIEATYTGATLRGLAGGDGYVWFGVNRSRTGVVNAWQLDSASAPFIALSLPAGETVDSLYFYLGNVFIASRTEQNTTRIYRAVPSEGRLTPQFVVETNWFGQVQPVQFAGRDRFVAFAWNTMQRSPESGIGVIDLESGGYARWQSGGGGTGFFGYTVSGVVRWAGGFAFTVQSGTSAGGLYGPAVSPVLHAGFLETSVSDLATNVVKVLDTVSLTTKPLNGSVEVLYSKDTNGTFASLGTMSGAGSTFTELAAGISGSSFGFKLVLTPSGAVGPVVKLLSPKTHPLGLVDQVVTFPVDCADIRGSLTGKQTPDSGLGRGREIARELEALIGTNVVFQDVDWPDQPSSVYQIVSGELVEKAGMYVRHAGKRKQHGVLVLTLRKPLS